MNQAAAPPPARPAEPDAAAAAGGSIDLLRFTFDSLYFCATPVEFFRGEAFLDAVNVWFMPLIRSGQAVPLSFLIDVGAMLLRPEVGFRNRWKDSGARDDVKALALRYFRALQVLRRQPEFAWLAARLAEADDAGRRRQAIRAFLAALVARLPSAQFRHAYSFRSRDLVLRAATPTAEALHGLALESDGETIEGKFEFRDPARVRRRHEFGTIMAMLGAICEFLETHPLAGFVTPEERLLWEYALSSDEGADRVDHRLLRALIDAPGLDGIEEHPARPRPVDDDLPADSFRDDGQVGGYIDIHRRPFNGRVEGILSTELALWPARALLLQRLLNDGALHYVREDVESIDPELRLLVCILIDGHPALGGVPGGAHPGLRRGATPSIRARALAALVLQDLARYLPRRDVRVDCAVYFHTASRPGLARSPIDLFSWTRDEAADRMRFVAGLIRRFPSLFDQRVGPAAAGEAAGIAPDPAAFLAGAGWPTYHGRHFVALTTSRTRRDAIPVDGARLVAGDRAADSIMVVECDLDRATVGVSEPRTLAEAALGSSTGQLGEDGFRRRFIATVLAKAAGRPIARDDDLPLDRRP